MDWLGDGVVTLVLGVCVAVAVFLPWANVSTGHDVNLSLHAAPGINGALAMSWGPPVLALAALVIIVGVVMVATRPVRLSMLPCLAVGLAGLGITLVCFSAGWSIWDPMRPGLGLFVATLGGILLMPTGLASAMVAYVLTSPAIMERVQAKVAARGGGSRPCAPSPVAPRPSAQRPGESRP